MSESRIEELEKIVSEHEGLDYATYKGLSEKWELKALKLEAELKDVKKEHYETLKTLDKRVDKINKLTESEFKLEQEVERFQAETREYLGSIIRKIKLGKYDRAIEMATEFDEKIKNY